MVIIDPVNLQCLQLFSWWLMNIHLTSSFKYIRYVQTIVRSCDLIINKNNMCFGVVAIIGRAKHVAYAKSTE